MLYAKIMASQDKPTSQPLIHASQPIIRNITVRGYM